MKTVTIAIMMLSFCYVNAIELNYGKVRSNLRGIKLYEQEKMDKALGEFESNVINNPGVGELHFNLGNAYYRLGDYNRALTEYDRALRDKEFNERSAAWHNIGNSFFNQQKYKEALDMYRNAIITDPENSDARYNYELTRLMLEAMENQEEPQSGHSDSEQQQMQDAEESDEQDGEEAEVVKQEEGDGNGEKRESDIDRQEDIQDAEDLLRTLLSREREFLEDEREHNRRELNFRGRFW